MEMIKEKVTPFEMICTFGLFISIAVLGLTMIYQKRIEWIGIFGVLWFWLVPYVIRWFKEI